MNKKVKKWERTTQVFAVLGAIATVLAILFLVIRTPKEIVEDGRRHDAVSRLLQQASFHALNSDYDSAIELVDIAMEYDPRDSRCQPRRLKYYVLRAFKLGTAPKKALAIAQAATVFNPNDIESWLAKATVEYRLRDYDAASSSYEHAVELLTDFANGNEVRSETIAEIFLAYGLALSGANAYPESARIKELLVGMGKDKKAAILEAHILQPQDRLEDAERLIRSVIDGSSIPEDKVQLFHAYFELGKILRLALRHEEAFEAKEKALYLAMETNYKFDAARITEEMSSDLAALLRFGEAAGTLERARNYYESIDNSELVVTCLIREGQFLFWEQEYLLAASRLGDAYHQLKFKPASPDRNRNLFVTMLGLTMAEAELGRQRAVLLSEEAVRFAGELENVLYEAEAATVRAFVWHVVENMPDKAIAEYRRILRSIPDEQITRRADRLNFIARALLSLGKVSEARIVIAESDSLAGHDPMISQDIKRITKEIESYEH